MSEAAPEGIAIIGMAGRFPGAADVDEFWSNLVAGTESISIFNDEELAASGFDVAALRKDPHFVPARGIVEGADLFDARFFGMTAKEAEVTDPQQRLFLETCWHALENAGYDSERSEGLIGVYAGVGINTYKHRHVHSRADVVDLVGEELITLGNEKDYLATRMAYKLNLHGPALNVNTACSTALVAVGQACQALHHFQCDMALAGGISVTFPQKRGTVHQEGGFASSDGRTRAFDAAARGTVFSDGLGVVVLKRLAEAIEDGDQVFAVIKGVGLNNDGSAKVSFTAPSVDGQTEAIALAQSDAGFDPDTISYVECHGTATPLGDPIEFAALTQAFRMRTARKGFCAIGSVKTNIGHLGAAAGIAGLIKTTLALKNKVLPPSLHYTAPNPKIDFANSPFYVNAKLTDWKAGPTPRRAGVSSFGFGGTNIHLVLEEASVVEPSGPSRDWQLLVLSGKTDAALDAATANLEEHLKAHPELSFADAAFTLQVGRRTFDHRRIIVSRDAITAAEAIEKGDPAHLFSHERDANADVPSVVFMFPGQGAQYVTMGADLYRTEPVFKEEIDRCAEILAPCLAGLDIRNVLYPSADKIKEAEALLIQTRITQPALFAIEYALAKLWMSWGIKPAALTGHSLGEYVAACLAGVFSLEDALSLVAERGRLIQSMPHGSMLAVSMAEEELKKILPPTLALAGVNGPVQCVVSGPAENIDGFQATLTAAGKSGRPLHTSHAFHSAMLDPVVQPFAESVKRVKRSEPTIPFISNLTGTWITADEARDPQYWARHLRQGVRFADGIKELLKNKSAVFLEVGPGTTLGSLTKFQAVKADNRAILSSLRHAREPQPDPASMLTALGHLWMRGVPVDWTAFHRSENRRRVTLPGYPFERRRYWIEHRAPTEPVSRASAASDTSLIAASPPAPALNDIEKTLAGIWSDLLGVTHVNATDNFFDLGGDSLLLMRVQVKVRELFNVDLAAAELFQYPTVSGLAQRLAGPTTPPVARQPVPLVPPTPTRAVPEIAEANGHNRVVEQPGPRAAVIEASHAPVRTDAHAIAIVGLAGRFPGARNVDEYWNNLVAGIDSTSFFTDEELAASDLNVAEIRANRNYVAARGIIDQAEWFDAGFFNIGAKEAEVMDPQHRVFLETAWEALENAGYDPAQYAGYVGVFAGMASNTYYLNNLHAHPELVEQVGRIAIGLGNEKDFIATRTAYKLNLRGPAISTNTACSTSLVAVCLACQSLVFQQCDIALAGGIAISFPQKRANLYQEGSVFSPDGVTRPFDAKAAGTYFSDGVGVVALKRLDDAIRDGDRVHAVIRGIGLNNDGSDKVGYTAPSVQGQSEAILRAQIHAGVSPESISYVEAHGTATPLGDPIEIAALTQAFRAGTEKKNFCAIGSVKGNFGHCDAAAGIAGLIKTTLALKHKQLPATLHFSAPNPKIDFANSPFFVNAKLTDWKAGPTPRRAGVSSFGIGGTNAHVVVEEAPALPLASPSRPAQLLLFSAKSATALDAMTARFVAHLKANPDINLADAAYTLQVGRRVFPHRRMAVVRDVADAIVVLEKLDVKRVITRQTDAKDCPVAFLFPGQGVQYVNMGADLYRAEPVFRAEIDRCAEILAGLLDLDIREVLFPAAGKVAQAEALLIETRIAQPALFVIEYALATLWLSWGVAPQAMASHSLGEFVTACLARVFTLEEALTIVAARSRLVQEQPGGSMLAVRLPEKELAPLLPEGLSMAALNSPALAVVAGPFEAMEKLEEVLKSRNVVNRRLDTSHAFHSAMMDPVIEPFTEVLSRVHFRKPAIPYVSNVTGRWITPGEATDPRYWARQVRETVRFAEGVGEILKDSQRVLLEVGPGRTLATFANQHPDKTSDRVVLASLVPEAESEIVSMLEALGQLWLAGKSINWAGFYAHERRCRVPLPNYPFQRQRYWIERRATPAAPVAETAQPQAPRHERPEIQSAFAVATSELERKLAEIWQEVFSLQEIGVDDSYFDLGGDSLLAVPLINKINAAVGCDLSIPVFFQNPTIRKLAPAIEELAASGPSSPTVDVLKGEPGPHIITYQSHGGRPPLFFLHGDWAGGGFYCGRLQERLGNDQPFYTLPPYRSGRTDLLPFEEMVDKYYAVIRAHTPRGPYIMGGYCIGGMIALEVARRFVAEGDEVPHLFQVDVPLRSTREARLIWGCVNAAGNVMKWDLLKKIHMYDHYPLALLRWLKVPLRSKILALGRRLKLTTAGSASPTVLGVQGGEPLEVLQGLDYNVYFLSAALHEVKPLSIPTSLYFAEQGLPRSFREKSARGVLLNATLEMIPGNHTTCITRHANVPAEKMARVLDAMYLPQP